jgi:hypothetical protein
VVLPAVEARHRRRSRAHRSKSTAFCTPRFPIMSGLLTPAPAARSGIFRGSPKAVGISGIGAAALLGSTLYVETPDCNLIALNIADGTERWHTEICDLEQFYYGSVAPTIVKESCDRRRQRRRSRYSGYVNRTTPRPESFSGAGTRIPIPTIPKRRPGPASKP